MWLGHRTWNLPLLALIHEVSHILRIVPVDLFLEELFLEVFWWLRQVYLQ